MPFRTPVRTLVASLTILFGASLLQAQTPSATQTAPPDPLPVRRVVLYKSGVGYFEHVGRVRGNQLVTIDFTSGQLDDVLKSITALDLTGGRVSSVQYNTNESLDRRLGALALPLDGKPTRLQFLSALRGARIEVGSGATRVTGRLLSVDMQTRIFNGATVPVEIASVVSDTGDMQTIALEPGVNVRILDRALSEEVSKYLSVMASTRERDVRRLSIAASGTGDRDLFVSYVSEVPVWKSTYRLVVPDAGDARKPLLQGWAIVDNTVGEDWTNVQLSLVAGAPQAFIQEISRPYYVSRPTVPLPSRFMLNPQTHGSAVTPSPYTPPPPPVPPPAPSAAPRGAGAGGGGRGLGSGQYNITIDGTTNSNLLQSSDGFLSRSVPRLDAIEEVTLSTARAMSVQQARLSQLSDADAATLGDLFEYKMKEAITIKRGQSALVPILSSEITAEKVSLWNAESDSRRALRAFWLTNSTGLTLDGGSFSIVEGQAFAGEGLMDPIKPGEKRLLSYAVDLGLTLDSEETEHPTVVTKVRVTNGMLVQSSERRRCTTYLARNQDAEPKTLIIEHPKEDGWSIAGDVKPAESTADWHRFRVTVAPNTTASLEVEEVQPVEQAIRVADINEKQIELLIKERALSAELTAALRDVQARKTEVARLTSEVAKRSSEMTQITTDQTRLRENMKSLKGTSEEKQLLQRYVRQLDEQENRIEQIRAEMQKLAAQLETARNDLIRAIETIK